MKSLIIFAIIATLTTLPVRSTADVNKPSGEPNGSTGEIALDFQSEKKDPYQIAQASALAYFKNLKILLSSVGASGKKIIIPDVHTINYLNGLYLFCTIKRGTCPAVLETLLEIDLVNSRLNNVAVCPVMKSFWKKYLENEFEDRIKYSVSTGFIAKVNEFNARERPKFLRCDDTLKELFKDGTSPSALFSSRYAANGHAMRALDELIALITAVAENNTNVFVATGSQS